MGVIVLAIALLVLPVSALVNVIKTPKAEFAAIGRSRTKWIVVLIVSAIYLVGSPFALYWFFRVVRQLREGLNVNDLSKRLR